MTSPFLAALAVGLAAGGFFLGRRRPLAALTIFLCLLGVVSSLPWQLGLTNVTFGAVFVAGFVLANIGRLRVAGRADETTRSRIPIGSSMLLGGVATFLLVVSASVAILEAAPDLDMLAHAETVEATADLVRLESDGRLAPVRAALIAVLGPALFLATLPIVATSKARKRVGSAMTASIVIALAGIVAQFLWLDPLVRPDLGRSEGAGVTGVVGFFQDPNSFAAFLVLAIGFSMGNALGQWREGSIPRFAFHAMVTSGAAIALVYTNSRGGVLAAGLATLWMMSILLRRRVQRGAAPNSTRAALGAVAATALILAIAATFLVSPLRAVPRELLQRIGAPRVAALFAIPEAGLDTYHGRIRNWATALELIRTRPVWGAGPLGLFTTELESPSRVVPGPIPVALGGNAHNYYLQIGSEFGVPSMIAFAMLVLSTFSIVALGAMSDTKAARSAFLTGVGAALIGFLGFCLINHPLLIAELQGFFWIIAALGVATAGGAGKRDAVDASTTPVEEDGSTATRAETAGQRAKAPQERRSAGACLSRLFLRRPWLATALSLYLVLSVVEVVRSRTFDEPRDRAVGVYGWEPAPEPRPETGTARFRWSADEAYLRVPVAAAVLRIPLYLAHPDLTETPVTVAVSVADVAVDRWRRRQAGWFEAIYYLPPLLAERRWAEVEDAWRATGLPLSATAAAGPPAGGRPPVDGTPPPALASLTPVSASWLRRWFGDWQELRDWTRRPRPPSVSLRFDPDSTFFPARVSDSRDSRRLGVGIGEPGWSNDLPDDGVGFHAVEIDWTGRTFRWTRRLASLPLVVDGREIVFDLRAFHTDIKTRPVEVGVYWKARRLRTVQLGDTEWQTVRVPVDAPRASAGVLSLLVDRTWNPAESGLSEDGRDLGVSVTTPEWR